MSLRKTGRNNGLTQGLTVTELLGNSTFPRRWWHWVLVAFAAELLWFCFMYPVVPRTVPALTLEALLPLLLLGYLYLGVRCLLWISRRSWSRWTRRVLTTAIAVGVGAVGIWIVDWAVVQTPAEFGYQLLQRL
jgi:hypothetical protein